MENIMELLPIGRENAVSRKQLVTRTGLRDRDIRNRISEAKKQAIIASTDDGSGYYIPEQKDYQDVLAYRRREHAKAIAILASLKKVDAWLDDVANERFKEGL